MACRGPRSSSPLERIPTDMLTQILIRVPSTALIAAAAFVCKRWLSLIVQPHFARAQLAHSATSDGHVVLLGDDSDYGDPSEISALAPDRNSPPTFHLTAVRGNFFPHSLRVRGSCDGLLLLISEYDNRPVLVCNPVLRQCVSLPALPPSYFVYGNRFLDQDWDFGRYISGLGFDSVSEVYKVLSMRFQSRNSQSFISECSECCIWSVGTRHWRRLRLVGYPIEEDSTSVVVNGRLHWLIGKEFSSARPEKITSFDLHDETFAVVPSPNLASGGKFEYALASMGGHLCLYDEKIGSDEFCIWVMKEYAKVESWTMDYVIQCGAPLSPVCLWRNDVLLLQKCKKYYVVYEKQSRSIQKIKIFRKKKLHVHGDPFIYTPSLIPLVHVSGGTRRRRRRRRRTCDGAESSYKRKRRGRGPIHCRCGGECDPILTNLTSAVPIAGYHQCQMDDCGLLFQDAISDDEADPYREWSGSSDEDYKEILRVMVEKGI